MITRQPFSQNRKPPPQTTQQPTNHEKEPGNRSRKFNRGRLNSKSSSCRSRISTCSYNSNSAKEIPLMRILRDYRNTETKQKRVVLTLFSLCYAMQCFNSLLTDIVIQKVSVGKTEQQTISIHNCTSPQKFDLHVQKKD